MLSNPRTSFRVASGNDVHSSVSGTFVSAVIRGGCPRPHRPRRPLSLRVACSQPPGPLDQPKQALPADNRRAHTRLSNDPCTMANRLSGSGRTSSAPWPTSPPPAQPPGQGHPARRMQYRPGLLDGFLAGTGLSLWTRPNTQRTPRIKDLLVGSNGYLAPARRGTDRGEEGRPVNSAEHYVWAERLLDRVRGVPSHATWRLSRFTRRHPVLCLNEPGAAPGHRAARIRQPMASACRRGRSLGLSFRAVRIG